MGGKMTVVVIGTIVIAVIVLTVISILDHLAMKKFDRHHL
jgi:hypothetical protein